MPDFTPNTIIQATVKGHQEGGSACYNVFQWWLYNILSTFDSDLIHPAIKTKLEELWLQNRDLTPGTAGWDEAVLEFKRPGDATWQDWTTIVLNLTGNDTGQDLPSGISPVVTGKTSVKKRRARKFLPAFGETYSVDQTWTAGALTKLAGWAVKWLVGTQVPGFSVWFYPIAVRAVDYAWTALTSAVANAIPGYQRRRKPGVGI